MTATKVTEKNLHSRNRNVQSEYRKQQIIQTTLECIEKYGLSQTTLANIARAAGISQGNVVFHFQSKENLLEQALQSLSQEYMACWQSALADAGSDSINQLCAMIQAHLLSPVSVVGRKSASGMPSGVNRAPDPNTCKSAVTRIGPIHPPCLISAINLKP